MNGTLTGANADLIHCAASAFNQVLHMQVRIDQELGNVSGIVNTLIEQWRFIQAKSSIHKNRKDAGRGLGSHPSKSN